MNHDALILSHFSVPEFALKFNFTVNCSSSRRIEIQSIANLDLLRESVDLECKRAGGEDGKGALPHDFWETYSAMANTDGSIVLLELQEKKGKFIPHSLVQPDRIRKDLADLANNPRKVSITLLGNHSICELEIDGHLLLQIEIPRATRSQRLVYLNGNLLQGNTYRRFQEADQRLGDEKVKRMLAEQTSDSLDLADDAGELSRVRKGDPRKAALASVVKANTSVSNEWLAQRLEMGHNRSGSRLIRQGKERAELMK